MATLKLTAVDKMAPLLATKLVTGSNYAEEILINAEYAESTYVDIRICDGNVTITNDGYPINDLSVLLTIGKSNWPSCRAPAKGIGFISLLHACRRIAIDNNRDTFCMATSEILKGESFQSQSTVGELDGLYSLKIKMFDVMGDPVQLFTEAAKISNIDVYINDQLVKHTYHHMDLVNNDFVYHHRNEIDFYISPGISLKSHVYINQRRNTLLSTTNNYETDANVIHIHNPGECFVTKYVLDKILTELIKQQLLSIRKSMNNDELFVVQFGHILTRAKYINLLDDIDYLPANYLLRLGKDLPTPLNWLLNEYHYYDRVIARSEIDDMLIVKNLDRNQGIDHTLNIYLYAKAAHEFVGNVTKKHWIHAYIEDANDFAETLTVKLNKLEQTTKICNLTCLLCDSYTISSRFGDVTVEDISFYNGQSIIVPKFGLDEGLSQQTSLQLEDEEDWAKFNTMRDTFNQDLSQLRTADYRTVVSNLLTNSISDSTLDRLVGKKLTIEITEDGKVSVL